MEGNLESTEIASHMSSKVFHCLHGDGGILCGPLTGIAALERDAVRAVISVLENVSSENPCPKAEKKEKVGLSDLINRQCCIVLRHAVAADKDRLSCNLVGRTILNPNDNDEKGLVGHPAMVSRPLDFRAIDVRLAAGAYGGSHEAFIDDV